MKLYLAIDLNMRLKTLLPFRMGRSIVSSWRITHIKLLAC